MRLSLLFTLLFSLFSKFSYEQTRFNGDFEIIDAVTHAPKGWDGFANTVSEQYSMQIDSVIKVKGNYSASIRSLSDKGNFGSVGFVIPTRFSGKEIELRGYIKTENVSNYAGLWLRVNASKLAFADMSKQRINGTSDWKEYTIKVPYDSENAKYIVGGALLAGTGKMWVDDLRLYIDGKPIDEVEINPIALSKAQLDNSFGQRSPVDTVLLDVQQTQNLNMLGQLWGFLKYHHPAVANAEYNFDAELFRVMPEVLAAKNTSDLNAVLEKWVDRLGKPPVCTDCKPLVANTIAHQADYGNLLDSAVTGKSLAGKLAFIKDNFNATKSYYVDMSPESGNPVFTNEKAHPAMLYPDAGYRLLSLFRYWSIIQYFFPAKYLIGEDWTKVLPRFIPKFVYASNKQEYVLATLELIASVHDTHANIWSNAELNKFKGNYQLPIQANFIENKLTVTGYYSDTLNLKKKLIPGDVITAINGVKVSALIEKYLPLTAASNYSRQLYDMPRTYLLRGNNKTFILELEGKKAVTIDAVEGRKLTMELDEDPHPNEPGFKLLNSNIGYVFPGKYKDSDLDQIIKTFAGTKGIIIDMRCYPLDFMPDKFVPYIKTSDNDFAKFTMGSVSHPGSFAIGSPIGSKGSNTYKGKVVVIVNEQTMSQAEYTTMAFQSSPNVTVIGSTTAGADGDQSQIILPGGITTSISGLGVLYPDGIETQRKGVKINIEVKPTIQGIKAGTDELLKMAMELVLK